LNCKGVVRELSEYLDGNLDPTLAQELNRHLEHCDDCRVVVDTTRKTIEIYCNTEPLPLPPDVRQRLHRALAEKLGPSS
jgi:anti-sigma factor RsiW